MALTSGPIAPALAPAAEDLANKIANHLEQRERRAAA
jgi:hypothetical protein